MTSCRFQRFDRNSENTDSQLQRDMSGQVNLALEGDSGCASVEQVDVDAVTQKTPAGQKTFNSEEDQILEVLRDVVRRCTNADPTKRPTAAAVLELLNACPVSIK
ncbi:hypothetical protein CAPTEDRAFT_225989 [Capitella teleta]|uniref:Protein kinase domain-containing protein n=1 Tax=Capitella teleta TaxID=283909 RepID=R7UDK3_CAPTE|nr:hypothetical protein CAPTEDRAFT_225989 [Capitella teleta]|eukprot:ELU04191.1 hypothetical protein CAPTEDRAFT_225989 [Capitella teleta]